MVELFSCLDDKDDEFNVRILFVTLSNIGDVVMSTAILTRLLEKHPDAIFDIVCGKGAVGLFDDFPNKGDVIPLIKMKNHMHYGALAWRLKSRKYDMVIDLRGSMIAFLTRTKKRVLMKKTTGHSVEQFARLVPSESPPQVQLWLSDSEPSVYEKDKDKLYIALAPTANWHGKQWPQKYWAELVQKIIKTPAYKHVKFVVLGAAHERGSIEDFLESVPEEHLIDLVGKTNLKGALRAIHDADIFIGNDSGLGHVAAAFQVPVISLFAQTPDKVYAPYGAHVKVVTAPEEDMSRLNVERFACPRVMTDISAQMVYDALRDMQDDLKIAENKKERAYA